MQYELSLEIQFVVLLVFKSLLDLGGILYDFFILEILFEVRKH